MVKPTLRRMRARDMVKLSRYIVPKFVGVVVMLGEQEIGSGSIVWGDGNRPFLSLEITEELRKRPVFMVKVAKQLIEAGTMDGDLYVLEDKDEPTSKRFLEFLGFKPTDEEINGERVLKWQR